jgi:hypothetical protein
MSMVGVKVVELNPKIQSVLVFGELAVRVAMAVVGKVQMVIIIASIVTIIQTRKLMNGSDFDGGMA